MAALLTPLATLVLISDIAIALFLLLNIAGIFSSNARKLAAKVKSIIARYALQFGFAVALVSTLGSLYFSEIAGFIPCELCWFQRIFMYPQAIIFGIALLKKDSRVLTYTLPLSVIGGAFSAYNYYLQLTASKATCSIGESCATSPFFLYGYITIATMALTGFVILAVIGIISRSRLKETAGN
jgi:disulfide bond formation protein DsbB